jgi:hypothetical protein
MRRQGVNWQKAELNEEDERMSNMGKICTICLVLTLCLAAIGVGYGHWTKTLGIEGTVYTGEVDIEFLNAVASDNEPSGDDNVGFTNVTLLDKDIDGDFEWMQVQIADGYYCYVGIVNFDVHNNGSVPVMVTAINIVEPVDPGDGTTQVEVALSGLAVGDVLDADASQACVLTAHIAANGSGEAGFTVDIEVVNWNEGVVT